MENCSKGQIGQFVSFITDLLTDKPDGRQGNCRPVNQERHSGENFRRLFFFFFF